MMAAAINPRSVAVETCCGAGNPVALMKRVPFIPIRAASRFIRSTNASAEPAVTSANAIAASLPDCTISPCSSSSTDTAFLGSMNILDPSARHAFWDTVAICDGVSSWSLSARKTRYAVIYLVSEAGSRGSSALTATRVWPLRTSIRRYALAAIDGGATAAGTTVWLDAAIEKKTSANNSDVRREKNIARSLREEAHYTVRRRVAFLARARARVAERKTPSGAPYPSLPVQFRRDFSAGAAGKRPSPSAGPIVLRRTHRQRDPDDALGSLRPAEIVGRQRRALRLT